MNRRTVLRGTLAIAPTAIVGCVGFDRPSGVNETVEFESEYPEDVTLGIVVEERLEGGETETVRDEEVIVPGEGQNSRKLLDAASYFVTVSGLDDEVRFRARPICDDAVTRVLVAANGELGYYTVDCEGIERRSDEE